MSAASIRRRSVMSRTAAETRMPRLVCRGDSEISAGNSVPSRRRASSSSPAPIGRTSARAVYPSRLATCPARTALGHENLDGLADQFVALVAEQPLGLTVDQDDPAVTVDDHHGVRRRLEQVTELFLRPLAFGDVAHGGGDEDAPAGL